MIKLAVLLLSCCNAHTWLQLISGGVGGSGTCAGGAGASLDLLTMSCDSWVMPHAPTWHTELDRKVLNAYTPRVKREQCDYTEDCEYSEHAEDCEL